MREELDQTMSTKASFIASHVSFPFELLVLCIMFRISYSESHVERAMNFERGT